MPKTITFNDMYSFYADEPLSIIDTNDFEEQSLPELIARVEGIPSREELRSLAHQELLSTLQSIRSDGRPLTVLHVLLLEDDQSRAEIAAALSCDPTTIAPVLSALAQERVVRCSLADGWIHYSISRPSINPEECRPMPFLDAVQ